ncbi:Hypp5432 [Branchiostoma lanceolatum]|uniref:Hypp5432 protein n=1 Tax=Branchiostoma lanceolatum TaxID=7740 RepID=A0A8J9WEW7_BRALA|nr:Hypp5432 [Branchiostoma lanceolatum]
MAEQGREGVPQEGQGAAGQPQPVQPPAVQQPAQVQPPTVELELQLPREWGRVVLRIYNERLAAGVGVAAGFGIGIAAFYFGNLDLALPAIRRAVERRDPDNPDQPANPQVGEGVREGSLLVPVIFYSQLGYQYFTSILSGPFLKACLQTELERVGYKEPIDVSVEKWELPNLPEGGAGPLMGMMRVQDWLAVIPEKVSLFSTAAGDSGIPEDVSSVAGVSTVASWEDVEEDGPSQAKRARLPQQPPAQVTPTAQQAELQEGPLKGLRAGLLKHKDSPTAQTWPKAYSCLERGEAMVTRGGYQQGEGVEHLLEGIMLMELAEPDTVNTILYDQLHLDKPKLNQLTSTQLQANPNSTPCLLLQALQLPFGHSRQLAINHVIDIVLQHGETDPMYKHLAYMYYALGHTIWQTTRQPAPALSAFASALMHKSDHLQALYFTAWCSKDVSVPQAIRQFHHYIHTAPTDHDLVPLAHYCLVTLYGQQDPSVHRDRILHHYNTAQQPDRNSLPWVSLVGSWLTDPARRVYEQVLALPHK